MKAFKRLLPAGCLLLAVLFMAGLCGRRTAAVKIERFADTVYIREVIRDTVLVPRTVYVARVDTVRLIVADTSHAAGTPNGREVAVRLPVERKVYETDFYRAVVEGYRPELLEMSVFPETKVVTNTEIRTVRKRPRFGVGVQAGYGVAGNKFRPYVGVGVQYSIVAF